MTTTEHRDPFIEVPSPLPGIAGLMSFKPETGAKIAELVQQLLRGASSLTPGEREVIAALVSSRNETYFCAHTHAAAARHLGEDVGTVVESIEAAGVSDKMRTLLAIAEKVQRSGLDVTAADIAAAGRRAPPTRTSTTPSWWPRPSACSTATWTASRRSPHATMRPTR